MWSKREHEGRFKREEAKHRMREMAAETEALRTKEQDGGVELQICLSNV